jgi:hypothetical protein
LQKYTNDNAYNPTYSKDKKHPKENAFERVLVSRLSCFLPY